MMMMMMIYLYNICYYTFKHLQLIIFILTQTCVSVQLHHNFLLWYFISMFTNTLINEYNVQNNKCLSMW